MTKTKKKKLQGHWTNRSLEDYQSRIAFDFVSQLEDRLESLHLKKTELAQRLGVTLPAVSQKLNNPDNLELKTIIAYSRALGLKVAVVPYDDDDPDNNNGPVNSEIFSECWKRQGRPTSFFDLNDHPVAIASKPTLAVYCETRTNLLTFRPRATGTDAASSNWGETSGEQPKRFTAAAG